MGDALTQVGVVAIGRNEGARLVRCLESVPRGLAVVYVDSGSTDGSVAAASLAGAHMVNLDMAIPFTAARARNEGWRALISQHPDLNYIHFVDGDCEFEPGWIAIAKAYLDAQPKAAVACGRRRERFPEASYYNRLCDAEWNTPVGEAEACGGDALVRTSALLAVDGYDSALMAGEEPEMCLRLREQGWKIHRLDAPMTIHDAAMLRFGQWWMRARRSGFGYAQVWYTTRTRRTRLYARELSRAVLWAGVVPIVSLFLAALMDWRIAIIAPLLWSAQVVRYGRQVGLRKAGLFLVGKFAELGGALAFLRRLLSGTSGHAITYK
jgi:glycosyltransferase involved in cell wall biosynthesis